MKKLFLRAEFGPLWEPWEEDEIGRKTLLLRCSTLLSSDNLEGENKEIRGFETTLSLKFLYLTKATKFSTLLLNVFTAFKSKVEISKNFVAF